MKTLIWFSRARCCRWQFTEIWLREVCSMLTISWLDQFVCHEHIDLRNDNRQNQIEHNTYIRSINGFLFISISQQHKVNKNHEKNKTSWSIFRSPLRNCRTKKRFLNKWSTNMPSSITTVKINYSVCSIHVVYAHFFCIFALFYLPRMIFHRFPFFHSYSYYIRFSR